MSPQRDVSNTGHRKEHQLFGALKPFRQRDPVRIGGFRPLGGIVFVQAEGGNLFW